MSGNREASTPEQPSKRDTGSNESDPSSPVKVDPDQTGRLGNPAVRSDYDAAKRQHELRYTRRFVALICGVLVGSVTLLLAFVFAFPEVPYRKVVLFIQVVLSPSMFVVFAAGAYYYGVQSRRYPPE